MRYVVMLTVTANIISTVPTKDEQNEMMKKELIGTMFCLHRFISFTKPHNILKTFDFKWKCINLYTLKSQVRIVVCVLQESAYMHSLRRLQFKLCECDIFLVLYTHFHFHSNLCLCARVCVCLYDKCLQYFEMSTIWTSEDSFYSIVRSHTMWVCAFTWRVRKTVI